MRLIGGLLRTRRIIHGIGINKHVKGQT